MSCPNAQPASVARVPTRAVSGSRLVAALTPLATSLSRQASARQTPAAASAVASQGLSRSQTATVLRSPAAASQAAQSRVATVAASQAAQSRVATVAASQAAQSRVATAAASQAASRVSAQRTPAASASVSVPVSSAARASSQRASSQRTPAGSVLASQTLLRSPTNALRTPAQSTPVAASAVASTAAGTRASRQTGLSRSATVAGLNYNSQVEQAVIAAQQPLPSSETQQVTAGSYRGVQLNRQEEEQFQGPVALAQYQINEDSNPEVLRKRLANVKYVQEVAVRRLQPPAAPRPGDLIIRERRAQVPAAPPVVLRQEGCRAKTPAPLVYREQPPRPPTQIPEQTVEVDGEPVPPPARRVVLEKVAPAPAKPQNILIERWLPYGPQTRRVVFQRSCAAPPPNPRNLVIEWEQAQADVEQVCKDLGVQEADPEEYRRQYGADLKAASDIPNLCQEPAGACGLSRQSRRSAAGTPGLRLEGDVDALARVDLDAAGLAEYRRFLQQQQ